MRQLEGTWPALLWVGLALAVALTATWFASTAYKRERQWLGQSHFRAGEAMARAQQNEGAVEQYRKALLFAPDSTRYRLSLAKALLSDNRLDEAQSYLEQLQDEDPTNPLIYVGLAQVALGRKQVSRAIQDYQHAVYQYWPTAMIPVRRQTRWKLVRLLDENGRRNEATGELLQLYASAPADPAEKDTIGFELLQNGAVSEANRIFSEVARVYPHDVGAQRGLARVQFASGDYVAARHLYQRVLRSDPHDASSQAALALTNSIIDIDGSLPGISEAERVRRSGNLLRRVLNDVVNCSAMDSQWGSDVQAAQKLLTGRHKSGEDIGFEYQQTAQQIWRDRAAGCGPNAPPDQALQQVFARAANE